MSTTPVTRQPSTFYQDLIDSSSPRDTTYFVTFRNSKGVVIDVVVSAPNGRRKQARETAEEMVKSGALCGPFSFVGVN